ncbi:protein-L-isoaspartate O-methyltransferase family protein [Derxia lacustris]|uniref:protein-L-isoaspartate O-methyltransferase family protein n=1 Tax=Derxia lacustris TaxID=764842 RepID=UPI000A177B63|nr:protein-L-isoaspartate O-methyltransferase [Derxia lacustris]
MTTTTLDFDRARFNMIEQQIRPWDVLDPSVLGLLAVVKREDFVPPAYRSLALADVEVPLNVEGAAKGEKMFQPRVEARVLQELAVGPDDTVLEIGTGSGFMAALLAARARHVTTVEIDPALARFAEANLARAGVRNAKVVVADGARGLPQLGEFDVIVISGGLPLLPPAFAAQLKIGGRLAAFVGSGVVMEALLLTKTGAQSATQRNLFETRVALLRNAEQPSTFRF